MQRRDFIWKTLASSALLTTVSFSDLLAAGLTQDRVPMLGSNQLDGKLEDDLLLTLEWMKRNGWERFLKEQLNVNVPLGKGTNLSELQKPLPQIDSIRKQTGFEDFAGDKLIEPGLPEQSLLYHMMASPRVKSVQIEAYPALEQLDALENYVYGFVDLDQYPYLQSDRSNVFCAVLAYEYRPGLKTPSFYHNKFQAEKAARMVFSRCGIARIGTHELNYDAENRLFTNKPKEPGAEKAVAMTAARYGVFLVELAKADKDQIQVMNQQQGERKTKTERYFVHPIAKIADTATQRVNYGEYHLNNKLQRLGEYNYGKKAKRSVRFNSEFDLNRSPFKRVSSSNPDFHSTNEEMVRLKRKGASLLVSSVPNDMIRFAEQNGKLIAAPVPEGWSNPLNGHTNRRHAAMKLPNKKGKEVTNVILSDLLGRRRRVTTGFKAPKVAPLFLNIKFEADSGSKEGYKHINGNTYDGEAFEDKLKDGGYQTLVFEDSICDGCICATINEPKWKLLKEKAAQIMPAFSMVTAPDFFPLSDSNDIRASYYDHVRVNTDQDFFEGGTMNLSGTRQRANPALVNPFTGKQAFANWSTEDKSFDTITAVVSSGLELKDGSDEPIAQNFERDFQSSSFLPDTGTGVFFPGWDVTYSGDGKKKARNPYLSTYGLGSPFPEDMKLCAAANGMWPVTSPDAGRTFQGSLEGIAGKKPNTSIPLMDDEIGIHQRGPHVTFHGYSSNRGWDGEQGPYLELKNKQVMINYTDIGRADYLQNLLDDRIGFDMSRLRKLESKELIQRMDCLRNTIKEIDNKKLWNTKLWLIGAEKISDWAKTQKPGCVPKGGVFDQLNYQTRQNDELSGEGYLFAIARAGKGEGKGREREIGTPDPSDQDKKRMYLPCEELWICQVTPTALAYARIRKGQNKPLGWQQQVFLGRS